jgi:hypothetical protein
MSEDGGDAACWSHLVCVACGRILDDSERDTPSDEPLCAACTKPNDGRRQPLEGG